MFSSLAAGVIAGGFAVNACGGDDSATPVPDSGAAETMSSDALQQIDTSVDASGPSPTGGQWQPTVLMLNLRPQPSKIFSPDGGVLVDFGFTVPLIQVTNNAGIRGVTKRPPDVVIDGTVPGLACVAYKFTSTDPRNPKGPGLTDGDMGNVLISGYSGGFIINPASGPTDAAVPHPTTCKRNEFFADSGIFGYGCDNSAVGGPTTGFMKATDTITVAIEGGTDVPAWTASEHPSPNYNLVVTDDLWTVPAAAVDGSADLTLNYNCGGGPCGMTSVVAVVIQTTDARHGTDAGPSNPFDFQNAVNEFGLIVCQDLLSFHPNSFTVKKELLAQLPSTWSDLRIVVGTVAAKQGGTSNGQGTVLAAGTAEVGFTHR